MAQNDRTPEQLPQKPPSPSEAPRREVDDFLDRADKARAVQQKRNKPLGEQILGILKKLSSPDVPPAEPVLEALAGETQIAPVDRDILHDIAKPQPRAPKAPDTFISDLQEAAAQGAQLGEQDKIRKDAQAAKDIRDRRDMAEDLQTEGYPIFSKIVSPDVDHSPAPVPERGTTQFAKNLEAVAQQGAAEGAAAKAQREAEEAAAAALAEAQRQAENAEVRRKIDSAGFKIPGLPENATEDEKRAARTAYVKQMMDDPAEGLKQATWQREQDQTVLDGSPQGQVKRDPVTGEIINPYKSAEAEPVYVPRVDALTAELRQREPWELTDRERRQIEPGLALPLISSRAEQAELFGFDVADASNWPGGEREMKAFQKAMAEAIYYFDQTVATPANERNENQKLDLYLTNPKTEGGGISRYKYFRNNHKMPIMKAVHAGVDQALLSHGPSEMANDKLRGLMITALETRVRIKRIEAEISKLKIELAQQKANADKEPADKKDGFKSIVERRQKTLSSMHEELAKQQKNSTELAAQLVKARAEVDTEQRKRRIDSREGVVSLDPLTGELVKKAPGYSEPIMQLQTPEAAPPTPSVPEAPVVAAVSAPEAKPDAPPSPEPPKKPESNEKEPAPKGEFVSAGESHRGGRPDAADEDAIFSGSGLHLGEIGGTKDKIVSNGHERAAYLATILHELDMPDVTAESIQATWDKIEQLKKEGEIGSLDIVLDGMGGHGAGEIASSIGMFAIVQEVANVASTEGNQLNGETVRGAMTKANELIKKYNEKKGSNSGATAIVALTTPDGRTILGSAGDARAYRIEPDGTTAMITRDHSFVFRSMIAGITEPSGIFKDPNKSNLYRALDGKLSPDEIEIYEGDDYNMQVGEKMVLVCDGVWESVFNEERGGLTATTDETLKDIDTEFQRENALLDLQFPNPEQYADKAAAREQLHMKYQGEIMKRILLAGHENDSPAEMAKHLTRETAGMIAGDNISAVVVERNTPPPPAAETAATPTEAPDWLTSTERVTADGPTTGANPETTTAGTSPAEASTGQPTEAETEVDTKTSEQEANEREAAVTQELVERKYKATAAVAFSQMLDGLHSLGQENSSYLREVKNQIEPKEKDNEAFKKATAKVLDTRIRNTMSLERRKQVMDYALINIAQETDPEKRKELAAEAKATAESVIKAWKGTATRLAQERTQVTEATSETELEGDGIRLPGEPATLTDQAEILNKQVLAAEAAMETELLKQQTEFNNAIDALVNIDETVLAEKQAAREDTRTAAEIAAEIALLSQTLEKQLDKEGLTGEDRENARKSIIDLLKSTRMRAPILITAVVVMGVLGIMTKGAAGGRRGGGIF